MPGSRRPPLDRQQIVRAALALIRREGLERLSMRRLARDLGVEAMSLYHHVSSKDDLLDECIAAVSASLDLSTMEQPGPWRERLKAGLTAYRALAREQSELFALVGHRPVRSLEVLRPIEIALGVFADAGFTPDQGIRAFRIVNSFVYGYTLSELTGLAVQAAFDVPLSRDRAAFPHLARAMPIARDADQDADFERGLDTILDGIAMWLSGEEPRAPATRCHG